MTRGAGLLRSRPAPAPAVAAERAAESTADAPVSELHLSEGRQGWTLTLTLTPDLLAAIDAARAGEPAGDPTLACRVHVQPNLVPGEPFTVDAVRVVTD